MAISNHERVGKGMELLKDGLMPFVEREMKAAHGEKWVEIARQSNPGNERLFSKMKQPPAMDVAALLGMMWDQWNAVFNKTLGHAERSLVSELRDIRNKWAHQNTFSGDDAYRALDSVGRLLTAVSAGQSEEIEKMRMELLRTRFEDQRRSEARRSAVAPVEGKPVAGLKPWREVVTPHPDVASGRYQQAEFAADLWQVYLKEGSDEYKHPTEFFRRTFLTEGLKQLLKGSLLRLAGKGGDPVVELQTNFGGGKTHSMLALYHLFSGSPASDLPGIEEILKDAAIPIAKNVKRAVIVGTKISPGQTHKKPDGTIVRTMWGEIAWQLGGKEGYKMVQQDDEKGTNPGDTLRVLFNKYAPCLILIDEWVAYARQLHEGSSLPAGTFDTQFTFAQALSESAKTANQTTLVVSIPSSDNEIGGEWGKAAVARLKNAVGRVESSWRPASADEGFEIVRRRLFQPITADQFAIRDLVAHAFVEMYGAQHQEFPTECREASYERRIKMAYPIHPELFDRLYNDWSTLDKFQRTRGVLRLMATVIHSLWERQDGNLLILPATVPLDDSAVQAELSHYLEDSWVPVIEKDVDGPHSLPLQLDRENPNLGRYSGCRRVARTIYMGSAPTAGSANRGIEDRQVKLGCVQPGENVATFGDALRRLTDRATHLCVDGKRYWYSTHPTVTRLAEDRATQLAAHDVAEEIVRRIRIEAQRRGDFAKVHACAASHADIPDEMEARLVILGPEHAHTGKAADSPARKEAAAILESRGTSPRNYKNTLAFLAADATRLRELEQAVRQYMAWKSIVADAEGDTASLNLDNFQMRQAQVRKRSADETVDARIPETYLWLLVPGQEKDAKGNVDPTGPVVWTEIRLSGQDALAIRAAKKMCGEELLLIKLGGVRLKHELDRIPLWRGDHVSLKLLAEDVAKYLYLPRMKDTDVLLAGVRDGVNRITWQSETFAYAEKYDEARKRYVGLQYGTAGQILVDSQSMLVKPEVAAAQLAADQAAAATAQQPATTMGGTMPVTGGGGNTGATATAPTMPAQKAKPRRFHGTVELDTLRPGRDAGKIAEEVVQHLSSLTGVTVKLTLEIEAEIPQGASDDLVRTITENCRTLMFKNQGFEES